MHFLLAVNPQSGKKRSAETFNKVKSVFDSAGIGLSVIETKYPGHTRELAANMNLDLYSGFLVLGGDGTFHELVNGMFDRPDGRKIPLGIIPGGSGNSFVRDLGLIDPIEAAKAITLGRTRLVDAAHVKMNDRSLYSMNLIGWGLVTDVGECAERLRWLGPGRYSVSSVIQIFLKKDRKASLIIDGQELVSDFTFIVACNSIHVGNGMKMAPNAKLDDGLIDLIVVEANITRRRLLSVLPKLFDGTHISEPEVRYYQASSFSLLSETNDTLNIDGEMLGTTPISVEILHNAIEVFG